MDLLRKPSSLFKSSLQSMFCASFRYFWCGSSPFNPNGMSFSSHGFTWQNFIAHWNSTSVQNGQSLWRFVL